MSANLPDLEDLRRQLDEIDDKLHDLLIERAEIVSLVGARKKRSGNQPALQPGREAEIIRRLVERHRGTFPTGSLVRMWREMLAATVRLQSPFAVAVYAPASAPGYWDLARDHYGSNTAMAAYGSVGQVIRAVSENGATIGVLPMPREEDADPWWRHLLSKDKAAPRIVSRLPFGARGNSRSDGADALAIGRFPQQPTGRDRSLFATETAAAISRARTFAVLSGLGLSCTFFASFEHGGGALNLMEIDDFVAATDTRLDGFREQLGTVLHSLSPLGGYAMPLPAAAFSPDAAAAAAATPKAVAAVKG